MKKVNGAQVIQRVFSIVHFVGLNEGVTLSEVEVGATLYKTTAQRMLKALVEQRILVKQGKKYFSNISFKE